MNKPLLQKKRLVRGNQGRRTVAQKNLVESSFIPRGSVVHASVYALHDSTQVLDERKSEKGDIQFSAIVRRMKATKIVFMECLVAETSILNAWHAWKAVGKKRTLLAQIQSLEELLANVPVSGVRGDLPMALEFSNKCVSHHAAYCSEDLGLGPCNDAGLVATLEMCHLFAFMCFFAVSVEAKPSQPKCQTDLPSWRCAKTEEEKNRFVRLLTNPPPESLLNNPIMLWGQFYATPDLQPARPKKNGVFVLDGGWMDLSSNLMPVMSEWACASGDGTFNCELEGLVISEFRSILSSSIAELKSALDMANVMQAKVLGVMAAMGLALFNFVVAHLIRHTDNS